MASTALVKNVLWLIGVQLQDTEPQFAYWWERELVDWLNAGQDAIAKYLPSAVSRVDSIRLKPGTRQSIAVIQAADCKLLDGSSPTQPVYGKQLLNPRRNMGANGQTPGDAIRLVERDIKDSLQPGWHSETGSFVREMVYDAQTPREFYVSPGVPANRSVWMELAYTAAPFAIPNTALRGSEAYLVAGSSTQTITVDDEFVDDLVNYVCARAHLKETKFSDRNKFGVHQSLFLSQLNAKAQAVTGNNPNLTVLPGVQG